MMLRSFSLAGEKHILFLKNDQLQAEKDTPTVCHNEARILLEIILYTEKVLVCKHLINY